MQVFFQLTDRNGIVHEEDVKPYEFDEAAVLALFNSRQVLYREVSKRDRNGTKVTGRPAVVEQTTLDLWHGIAVLRVKLVETAPQSAR